MLPSINKSSSEQKNILLTLDHIYDNIGSNQPFKRGLLSKSVSTESLKSEDIRRLNRDNLGVQKFVLSLKPEEHR
jgi:hypothetical protein